MPKYITEIIQGSPEWLKLRAGVFSASSFDKVVTSKGLESKQAQKYIYQLAGEKITGAKEESYQSAAMERGVQMEDEARKCYSLMTGNDVTQVGFCFLDDSETIGASPDGVCGDLEDLSGGLVEIKCPTLAVMVEYLLENKAPTKYYQQLQGQLYVTGRKWVDFVAYYPNMPLLVVRVARDERFIASLKQHLALCVRQSEIIVNKIK